MIKYSSRILLAFALFFSFSVLGQEKTKARNHDPGAITKQYYDWNQKADLETSKDLDPKDVWYSTYTAPKLGYVKLFDDSQIEGMLVIRWRYNVASTMKVKKTDSFGNTTEVPHPDGEKGVEDVRLTMADGEELIFPLTEIKSYGHLWTMDKWPVADKKDYAASFNKGTVYLKNGGKKEGFIRFGWVNSSFGIKYYDRVFFAAGADDYVETFVTEDVEKVEQIDGGKAIYYDRYSKWLVRPEPIVEMLKEKAKKNDMEELAPGTVVLANGKSISGDVSISQGKKKSKVIILVNGDAKDLDYFDASSEDTQSVTVGGVTYVPLEDFFTSYDDLLSDWEKKDEVVQGTVFDADGKEVSGRLVKKLKRRGYSYRAPEEKPFGFYFMPAGKTNAIEFLNSDAPITKVVLKGGATTFYPLDDRFVEWSEYGKIFKPGRIVFQDGTEKKGELIRNGLTGRVTLMDANEQLTHYLFDRDAIDFVEETKDGKLQKFVPMKSGIKAFSGPSFVWVQIHYFDERYSYYFNPNPGTQRKLLTKVARTAGDLASDEANKAMGDIAAKSAAQNEAESGGNLSSSLAAAKQAKQDSKDLVGIGEGGIYFKEWVIIDNENGTETPVHKKNEKKVLKELIESCVSRTYSDGQIKDLATVDRIDEVVVILNGCE